MGINELASLLQEVLRLLDQKIKAENVRPRELSIVKYVVTRLEMSETSRSCEGTFKTYPRLDWSTPVYSISDEEVKNLVSFKNVVSSIAREYRGTMPHGVDSDSQAEFWLSNLVRSVMYAQCEKKLDQNLLMEYICAFINKLNGAPIKRSQTAFLDGVYIAPDEIEVDSGVILRKLRPADLEYEYILPFPPYNLRSDFFPSGILELSLRARRDSDLSKKTSRILTLLSIYRLGSVQAEITKTRSETLLSLGDEGFFRPNQGFISQYAYTIHQEDIDPLKHFYEVFEPLLPEEGIRADYAISLAMDRYRNALLEKVEPERKILSTVSGLEALYSLRSDRGENEYKLSSRVAVFLSFLGFDPIKVRLDIKNCYKVRNCVAHGLEISESHKKELSPLLLNVLQYLRRSLILFLVLRKLMEKDKIVQKIDDAMISESDSNDVEELLENNLFSLPFDLARKMDLVLADKDMVPGIGKPQPV